MTLTVTTILFGLPEGRRQLYVDLALPASTLTVRELIAQKVAQEVAEVAAQQRPGLSGEYLDPEELIRATSLDALAPGTVAEEIERAQQAFAERAYMIVIDEQPIWDPDAVVTLVPQNRIEFIKILPLVGG
jgi:hypothetical protein